MDNLQNIETWKKGFGLLPIRLLPSIQDDNSFIMLNGGSGDFCIKPSLLDENPEELKNLAWSSNTKNFVVVEDEHVAIYNWKKTEIERTKLNQVSSHFGKFYNYIVRNSFHSEDDIVPFVIDLFKRFRNLTREKYESESALNLLFLLLSSLEDDLNDFDFDKWGLNEIEIPDEIEKYSNWLRTGIKNLSPKLDVILRHSAGALFQEAQKEIVMFDSQIDLWGLHSGKIQSKPLLYSSIHYTPDYFARAIVENALQKIDLQKEELKIFDPACGSGEFLKEALKQLNERGYNGRINLIGWDISNTAIDTTRYLLTYEKRTLWQDNLTFNLRLVEDSLIEDWDDDYDLILMNPPFLSWEQMNKEMREVVRGNLGANIRGKPNQASAFFYKAINSTIDDGALGAVIPSSILTLDSYKDLRNEIEEISDLELIGKFGNYVFEEALTDVSIIIVTKSKNESLPLLIWTKNEKGIASKTLMELRKMQANRELKVDANQYSIYTPDYFPVAKESWKPISLKENNLLKKLKVHIAQERLQPVINLFDVKQGVRTGQKKVFVIDKTEFDNIPKDEKKYFRPVADNDSIKNHQIILQRYLWYPYDEDGIIIETEDSLAEKVPYFYENHLLPNKNILIELARKNENNWWHLSEHRAWLRNKEKRIISGEFGSSKSFALDLTGEFVVERGNAWIPKKSIDSSAFYFYLAVFSSSVFDSLLSIYSKELAGGKWYDLGKMYTKEIPIPNLLNEEVKDSFAAEKLKMLGQELAKNERNVQAAIDELLIEYFYPY
jgi:type I restriction-modification system DNA methylase subunit